MLQRVCRAASDERATEAAAALGKPAVVELDAVTLDLTFRGAATEGQFKAYRSRILDAQVWAGKQTSHADQTGFFLRASGKQKAKKGAGRKQAAKAASVSMNVLVTLKPAGDAVLEVDTDAGKASIKLNDVGFDKATNYLDGELAVRRLPSPTQLAFSATDNDYPAAAQARDGRIWVAFVAYQSGGNPDMEAAAKYDFRSLVPSGNGDQIRLVMFDGRQWSAPLAVTEGLLDLWKPTVAVDGAAKSGSPGARTSAAIGTSTAAATTRPPPSGRPSSGSPPSRAPTSTWFPPPTPKATCGGPGRDGGASTFRSS